MKYKIQYNPYRQKYRVMIKGWFFYHPLKKQFYKAGQFGGPQAILTFYTKEEALKGVTLERERRDGDRRKRKYNKWHDMPFYE